MSLILINNYLKSVFNGIIIYWKTKKIFYFLGILVLIIFEFLIFFAFINGFFYIKIYFPGGTLFVPKLLAIVLMVLFNFLVVMSLISAIPTLYKNNEIINLLSKPIESIEVFKYFFFKNILYLSLGALFILVPLFLAYGIYIKFSYLYFFLMFILIFLFIFLGGIFGIYLFFAGAIIFIFYKKFILYYNIKYIGIIIKLILFLMFFGLIYWIYSLFNQTIEGGETFLENFIITYKYNNILFANNWFVSLINYFEVGNSIGTIVNFSFIFFSVIFFYELLLFIARNHYYNIIQELNSLKFGIKNSEKKFKTNFGSNVLLNLLKKEYLIHKDDPVQRIQLLIFLFLIIIYILVIKGINFKQLENSFLVSLISLITIGSVIFLVSAIGVRFVYPNISLEGKFLWLFKSLPIGIFKIYFAKLLFFYIFFLILGILIYLIFGNLIGLNNTIILLGVFILIPLILFIISFYFSLGIYYPDFKDTNPSRISTSIPGVIAIIVSNGYIILISFFLANKINYYYENLAKCNDLGLIYFIDKIFFIYLISILFFYISVYFGYYKFKNLEV